jgi:hypothetical protein
MKFILLSHTFYVIIKANNSTDLTISDRYFEGVNWDFTQSTHLKA